MSVTGGASSAGEVTGKPGKGARRVEHYNRAADDSYDSHNSTSNNPSVVI
jgi:hypothetical protein